MTPTSRTEIPSENSSFYSRELLERATPYLVHTSFAQVRDIPANSGTDTIKFRKYGNLAVVTTALSEGVTPVGKQMSASTITAQIQYYGDYITITDKLQYETLDPILMEAAGELGDQAGDSVDQIARDVFAATTTIQYASTAAARTDITPAMILNAAEVKEAVRTLKVNLAKPLTSRIDPSTGFNTVPLKHAFVMVVHPRTSHDIEDAPGFTPVEKYANKSDVMENEIGSFPYVRVVETTNAKVYAAGGASSADVYASLIFARNAVGITRLSNMTMMNIVKPLGSAGTSDPLDQRATSGWKLSFVAKVLRPEWLLKIEHGVSA